MWVVGFINCIVVNVEGKERQERKKGMVSVEEMGVVSAAASNRLST